MKHKYYIIRQGTKGEAAHMFQGAKGDWYAEESFCGRVISNMPASEPGDGRRICRRCASESKRLGFL